MLAAVSSGPLTVLVYSANTLALCACTLVTMGRQFARGIMAAARNTALQITCQAGQDKAESKPYVLIFAESARWP
jgi:hypothetical protein